MLSPDIAARKDQVINDYHLWYYQDFEHTWEQTFWMGTKILKCPLDLWIYQEILFETKPEVVLETGTAHGGSALWFAHMLDLLGKGEVITIDVEGVKAFPNRPKHDRITYLHGSSTEDEIIKKVNYRVANRPTLVVLDSAHTAEHVEREMNIWCELVRPGGYLIVEDSNVHNHPVAPEHPPGPMEAIDAFLTHHDEFDVDLERQKFGLTFNPNGYLRRRG